MARTSVDAGHLDGDPDVTVLYARRKKWGEAGKGEVVRSPLGWHGWQSPAMAPARFLRSTAADLLRYLEVFRTGGTVSAGSVAAMTGRHERCDPGSYCGFHSGVTLVEHGGSVKGVAAQIMFVPERGLTAVGLANLAGAPTGRVDVASDGATLTFESGGERSIGRRVGERAYAIVTDGHDVVVRFLTLAGETAVQSGLRVLRRPAPDAASTARTGGR